MLQFVAAAIAIGDRGDSYFVEADARLFQFVLYFSDSSKLSHRVRAYRVDFAVFVFSGAYERIRT